MSCYDDNPLTTQQQHDDDCRMGRGHLRSDKPAGVLTLCPNCKGYQAIENAVKSAGRAAAAQPGDTAAGGEESQ